MRGEPIRFLQIAIVVANHAGEPVARGDAAIVEDVVPGHDVMPELRLGQVDHEVERGKVVRPALEGQLLDLGRRPVGHRPIEDYVDRQRGLDALRQLGEEPGPRLGVVERLGKAKGIYDHGQPAVSVIQPQVGRNALIEGNRLVRDLAQAGLVRRDVGLVAQHGPVAGVQHLPVVEESDFQVVASQRVQHRVGGGQARDVVPLPEHAIDAQIANELEVHVVVSLGPHLVPRESDPLPAEPVRKEFRRQEVAVPPVEEVHGADRARRLQVRALVGAMRHGGVCLDQSRGPQQVEHGNAPRRVVGCGVVDPRRPLRPQGVARIGARHGHRQSVQRNGRVVVRQRSVGRAIRRPESRAPGLGASQQGHVPVPNVIPTLPRIGRPVGRRGDAEVLQQLVVVALGRENVQHVHQRRAAAGVRPHQAPLEYLPHPAVEQEAARDRRPERVRAAQVLPARPEAHAPVVGDGKAERGFAVRVRREEGAGVDRRGRLGGA